MENLIISLNVVLPLFILMGLGYGLRFTKLFDDHALRVMNASVFKVFLPTMLFYNIYRTNIKDSFSPGLLAFAVITVLILFIASFFLVPIWEKDGKKCGVMIQGIFRSNCVIFGIPLVQSMFGDAGAGTVSFIIAIVVPIYNVMAVIALSAFVGKKINLKGILRCILTNSLIVASALGLACVMLELKLPFVVEKAVSDIGGVATPLALIVLGASFNFGNALNDWKRVAIGVLCRLLVVPAVFLPIAAALGFRNAELMTLIAVYAAPAATSSFAMAQSMGNDGDLAASLLVFGAALSVVTIFLITYFCINMGWMVAAV